MLIIRTYGIAAGGTGNNILTAAAEYRHTCYRGRDGFSLTLSKAIKIHPTLKCLERYFIFNNSFNNWTILTDGRKVKYICILLSVPISLNLSKVMIATEPRKYSKYNKYVVAETKTFCDICFSPSFTQTAMPKFIFGGGGCTHSLYFSLLLLSFSNASIFRFFFFCSHTRN